MTTEERLEKVEKESATAKRQIRRLMIGGAAGLACVAVLLALWAPQAEVQARKFVLVDENGETSRPAGHGGVRAGAEPGGRAGQDPRRGVHREDRAADLTFPTETATPARGSPFSRTGRC